MRRNSAAPTHTWLIGNRIMRTLAWCFLFIVLVTVLTTSWTIGALDKECLVPVKKDFEVAGYWIQIDIGKDDPYCASPTR